MSFWSVLADGPGYQGFFADLPTTFWSGFLRIVEAMVAAAPFLVAGVLAAGLLRGMVGASRIRKMLGVGHWSGPFRAWGLGVLLPICSLGALPVARELRRAGVPSGTVLSFVLVGPVLNPVSIIYGLSHIVPITLAYFAVGTFVVSVGIGMIWNHFISNSRDEVSDEFEHPPRSSVARLAVVGDTAARGLVGPVWVDYSLALLAVGFLGAFLPHGVLATGLTRDNVFAPVIMGLVAIPVYVTPTEVMMHFGNIVKDGYSLGAAFALIVLGAGANLGVANWIRRDYGPRPLFLFVAMLIGSTLVIGLTADRAILHGNATMADHTHAFDDFTRLSSVNNSEANVVWVWSQITRKIKVHEVAGFACLLVIFVAGVVLRGLGDRVSIEPLMQSSSDSLDPLSSPRWDPALSPRQLAIAGALGVFIFAVIGLYLYYPSPKNLFADMSVIRVEAYDAVKTQNVKEARRRLAQWRGLAEKLPTSQRLRTGNVTQEQLDALDEVLYSVDTLEQQIATGQFSEAKVMIRYVEKTYGNCCDQYRESESESFQSGNSTAPLSSSGG